MCSSRVCTVWVHMYALRAVALCTWGTIPCARAAILARLEEQHRLLAHVKVDVVARLVRHVRTKVSTHEAMPHAIVLRTKHASGGLFLGDLPVPLASGTW